MLVIQSTWWPSRALQAQQLDEWNSTMCTSFFCLLSHMVTHRVVYRGHVFSCFVTQTLTLCTAKRSGKALTVVDSRYSLRATQPNVRTVWDDLVKSRCSQTTPNRTCRLSDESVMTSITTSFKTVDVMSHHIVTHTFQFLSANPRH